MVGDDERKKKRNKKKKKNDVLFRYQNKEEKQFL